MLHERFDAPCEHAAREHDPVPAPEADEADVRAEPDDFPVRAAAGMRLPQAYDVVKRNIEWHPELPTKPLALSRVVPTQQGSIAYAMCTYVLG